MHRPLRQTLTTTFARFKAGSLPIASTNLLILGSGLLTGVAVARALGPEGRGDYVAWQAVAAVSALTAFVGCPQSIVLLGRQGLSIGRTEAAAAATMAGTLGSTLAVVAVWSTDEPSLLAVIGVVFVVVSTLLGSLAQSFAQRDRLMTWHFNAGRLVPQVSALIAISFLVISPLTSSAVWLLVVALSQTIGISLWLWSYPRVAGEKATHTLRPFLSSAIRLGPLTWISLLQYKGDILLAGLLLPRSTVGYYAVGLSAQAAVFAAGSAGGMRWFAYRGGRETSLAKELGRSALLAAGVALLLAVAAPVWVPFLYGEEFAPAVPIVALLCAAGVLQVVDYFLAHEGLLEGIGSRIAALRLPGIAALLLLGILARRSDWAPYALAFATGLSFAISAAVIHITTISSRHTRRPSGGRHSDSDPNRSYTAASDP
jgi:O-antigen/teichoic acid export membrane protein